MKSVIALMGTSKDAELTHLGDLIALLGDKMTDIHNETAKELEPILVSQSIKLKDY